MTIVVPVKNRATLVLRTLAAIRAQVWRPLKVIVVDNDSSDDTVASVTEWIAKNQNDDFEVSLIEEKTPGAAAARNAGLEAVDTRLMMYFDSDDIMSPLHVETIMKRFHAGDEPDLVCFRVNYHPINGEDRITKRPGRDMMVSHICHGLLRTQGYACETALARRAGGWDESLKGWDDLEYGSRILMESRRKVFIPDINVDVYARADSITGTEFSSRKGEWEMVIDKIERNFAASRQKKREKWIRVLSYKKTILAAMYKREKNSLAASRLMENVLSDPSLDAIQRFWLKLAYRYTSLGGRGSAILVNLIF